MSYLIDLSIFFISTKSNFSDSEFSSGGYEFSASFLNKAIGFTGFILNVFFVRDKGLLLLNMGPFNIETSVAIPFSLILKFNFSFLYIPVFFGNLNKLLLS